MIRCPACGTENKLSTKFCRECGVTLPAEVPPEPANDSDRTVLLPPRPDGAVDRSPGTIEQAMLLPPATRKAGDRPPPSPPDNEMTVVLPKKSAAPPPKYEPAPPTVTGPLTEPVPHPKSPRRGAGTGKSSVPDAVSKPKTPVAVVLALLVIAGGSAGYLGWLILKKNKAATPAEKVAVAPQTTPAVAPPATPSTTPAPPAAPTAPVAPTPAAPSAVATPPETPAAPPPPAPKPAPQADVSPAPGSTVPAEPPKTDATKAERAKAEQLKKEQARLEAAKKEKLKKSAPIVPTVASEPDHRPAEPARSPAPATTEPVRQEPTQLAVLRDELRACDAQNILAREFCKHQARQRRCAGMWDSVPECPVKKENRLY